MLDRALTTSLRLLTNSDIEEIAGGGVQEDGVTEFKSGLDEGTERDQTSWADGGKLSRPAKTDLLRALIAFANAYGGTLYIGVKESNDEPKRSCGLAPLPRIFALEAALCDAIRDTIEPRLPSFDSRAFDFESGAGILVIQVPASPIAPHWNTNERQCYQRIGSSSQKIGMREIRRITLDRARTSQLVDEQFGERRSLFESQIFSFATKANRESKAADEIDSLFPSAGMSMRCTCVPLIPINVSYITERPDLRIGTKHARVANRYDIPGTPKSQGINNYENIDPREFKPALRGWSREFTSRYNSLRDSMLVRGDGLIERVFIDLEPVSPPGRYGVPFVRIAGFVLSTLISLEVFRNRSATNEVPYELEFDLIAFPERFLMTPFSEIRAENCVLESRRTIFPRLLIGHRSTLKAASDAIQIDILNAANQPAYIFYDLEVESSLNLHEQDR